MLTDEQAMKLIEKRKITKFKNGERDPELLGFILNYLEKSNDLSLLNYIVFNNCFSNFEKIDIGYKRMVDIAIRHEDPNCIYALALFLPYGDNYTENIDSLEKAIIKSGNAKFIYRFALKVNHADAIELWDAILKIGDIKYIRDFILNVEDIDYDSLSLMAQKNENQAAIKILNSYDIRLNKELEQGLIPYATEIVNNNHNRLNTLNELIDSVTDKESLMKLKIYGEFLQKTDNDIDDMLDSIDINSLKKEALELDKEYTEYVKKKSK